MKTYLLISHGLFLRSRSACLAKNGVIDYLKVIIIMENLVRDLQDL